MERTWKYPAQYVSFKSMKSATSIKHTASSGIPQGTVVGLFLVAIYINDFPNTLSGVVESKRQGSGLNVSGA